MSNQRRITLEVALAAREVEVGAREIESAFASVGQRAHRMSAEMQEAQSRLEAALQGAAEARAAREAQEVQDRQRQREQEIQQTVMSEEERQAQRREVIERAEADWKAREEARAEEARQRAAQSGLQEARARAEALETQFRADQARIKEGMARGFLTPEEAKEAGREAAEEYNRGMVEVLDTGARAGAFRGAEGRSAWVELASGLKQVESGGTSAAMGVGRLNQALTSTLRQATATNPAVAQLANAVGSFALGGFMMTGVLAGLGALALAWNRSTASAREAKKEADEALERLSRARAAREQGALGQTGEDVGTGQSRLDSITAEREAVRQRLERAVSQGRENAIASLQEHIRRLDAAYEEAASTVRGGEAELQRIAAEAYQAEVRDQASRLASLVAANRATAAERERLLEIQASQQFALAQLEAMDSSPDVTRRRAEAVGLIQQIASAFDQRRDATQRAAEASARAVRELSRQVEEEASLSAALQVSRTAYDDQLRAIERANAVRSAQAQAVGADIEAAGELAGRLFDLRAAREADLEAQERALQVQGRAQELANINELLRLTQDYVGTVEDLERAQRDLIQAQEDRALVEQLLAEGGEAAEIQAYVAGLREARNSIEEFMQARRRAASSADWQRSIESEIRATETLIRIHREHRGSKDELQAAVEAHNQELTRQRIIEAGLQAGWKGSQQELEALADRYARAAAEAANLGRAAQGASDHVRTIASAGVGAAGGALGGAAQDIAGIITAGIAGGPVGAIATALGTLGRVLGGSGNADAAREQARLAEEARRAAEALAQFSAGLADDMRIRGLRLSGDNVAVELERMRQAQGAELQEFLDKFLARMGGDRTPQGLIDQLFGRPGPEGRTNDELRALIESERGNITDEAANLLLQWLDLLDLQAREMQDIYDRQAQREEEEARRRAAAAASFELDMERVTIALFGTDREARAHDLERAMERQLEANRKLLDEGVITAEQFEKMADLLRQQVNAALDEFDAAARRAADAAKAAAESERLRAEEAARAERLRQATDEERLRIQLLRARGEIEAAQAAEGALAIEIALREGRSSNYLIMLEQLNAIQLLNAAQQQAAESADTAARALGGMGSALNAAPRFNAAWAMTRATSGAEIATRSMASAAPVVQNFNVDIHGSNKSARELFREMQLEADRIRRRGGGDPWDSVEA